MRKVPLELKVGLLLVGTIVLMVSAGFLTYRNMSSMVSSILKQARPDLGLVHLKEISSNLTDADNSVRLYMVTGNDDYLKPYYSVISTMDSSINLLYKNVDNNPRQITLIDSVSHLISDKIEVWDELLKLRNNTRVTRALDVLSRKFLSEPEKETTDTLKEKRNVIRRFFSHRNESEVPAGIEPSALKEELSQIEKMQVQDSIKEVQIKARELTLVQRDRELTTRLTSLISTIENDENLQFERKAYQADLSAGLTYRWLIIFGSSVFLLLLIVLLVIINYVRKTNATQTALLDAKNEAENLARAKELFVANVSHEMRSPMNAISGLSEQLLEWPVDEKVHEQLLVIRKSSDHLLGVVNEILDFSKLQAGKIVIEKIDFYLSDVIEEVIEINSVTANKKELKILHRIDPSLPAVLIGDPVRLKQILHNLMSNAIKFTDTGSVSLEVTRKGGDDRSVLLEIAVSDTGIGIGEDKLDTIFEDFAQEETSTARQYGGTGLGLSIVKRLIDLMGGTIRVESRKQEGSTFTVTLPFSISRNKRIRRKSERADLLDVPDFDDLEVLVADDEEFNKVLLRMIFNKWNIRFREVSNGKEAVEAAKEQHFDLILMDIRMPVMDGITATAAILKDAPADGAPKIIGVSATSTVQDIRKCRDAGMIDFVSKPYREEALKKVMRRVTGRTASREVTRAVPADHSKAERKKLDLRELYHLGDGDQQFIKDLLNIFIQNSKNLLDAMDEALQKEEWTEVADAAHRLSSPSHHLRADRLYELLKLIENSARQQSGTVALPGLLAEAREERNDIVMMIRKHMAELKKIT